MTYQVPGPAKCWQGTGCTTPCERPVGVVAQKKHCIWIEIRMCLETTDILIGVLLKLETLSLIQQGCQISAVLVIEQGCEWQLQSFIIGT